MATYTVTSNAAPGLTAAALSTICNRQVGACSLQELRTILDAASRYSAADPAAIVSNILPTTVS